MKVNMITKVSSVLSIINEKDIIEVS